MLLETLDVKKNDVLIYSENRFDIYNNFKIVFKRAACKKPSTISIKEVGEYLYSPAPKTLILYRLLTNLPEFNARMTQHGIFLQINNSTELVYYDPVFAVKDIEKLENIIDFGRFRFKIHQIGLISSEIHEGSLNYNELYHFDMKADEAKNQNDKVYADAIFAFDNDFTGHHERVSERTIWEMPKQNRITYKPLNMVLSEEHDNNENNICKPGTFPDMKLSANDKTNEFHPDKHLNKKDNLLELFKSASSYVSGRSGESVILKFQKDVEK